MAKSANDELVIWNNTQFRLSDIKDDKNFHDKVKREGTAANAWFAEQKAAKAEAKAEAAATEDD